MNDRCFVIAEAGVNHCGDLTRALEMVDVAAAAGADAIKFQTFVAERLTTSRAAKCSYQERNTGASGAQQDMLRALELPREAYRELAERCRAKGIEFMSTGFDGGSLAFLVNEVGLKRIKIPSGEMVNPLLLLQAARSDLPIVVSTGLADQEEVAQALGVLAFGLREPGRLPSPAECRAALASEEGRRALAARVTLLHCVTDYPASPADTNLRAMGAMARAFGVPVGLSDHTEGIAVPIAAVALGASIIEKHFTLDRNLPGPDHKASLTPPELAALVAGIRTVEQALGDGTKAPRPGELGNRDAVRGSLVAARRIRAGTRLTLGDLSVKRPGDGLSPMALLELVGTPAAMDYEADDQLHR